MTDRYLYGEVKTRKPPMHCDIRSGEQWLLLLQGEKFHIPEAFHFRPGGGPSFITHVYPQTVPDEEMGEIVLPLQQC